MATKTIEVRAKYKNGITTINALITHPMEAGSRIKDKAGNIISPHFIQEVTCTYQDEILLTAQWGVGMPMNPYLSFGFNGGEKGEEIILKWVDNKGGSDTTTAIIK